MKKINIDGSALSFEQDGRINFEEEAHVYTVDGVQMTPVSSVIASFFKPFDAETLSLRKCRGDIEAAARMREEWNCSGKFASEAGTHMHKQIEEFLNTGKQPDLKIDIEYVGNYVNKFETVDISSEWNHFMRFRNENHFTPFRTEWCVFDFDARIAGTIDLICSCSDGSFEIYDWKRSSRIDPQDVNRWANGLNGLEHLTDTAYVHYCLQQNLYRHILEKNYGIRISRMNLVVLHNRFSNYEIVPIPRMESEVQIIWDTIMARH